MIELNKVFLVGRLTRDPEIKYLPSGMAVAELRLAADRSFYDKNAGESKKESLFINATTWGKTAEFCNQWFKKGSGVFVEGRLKLDQWQDRDGNNRERISITVDRVQFAETKAEAQARQARGGGEYGEPGGGGESRPPRRQAPADPPEPEYQNEPMGSNTEDDLPF